MRQGTTNPEIVLEAQKILKSKKDPAFGGGGGMQDSLDMLWRKEEASKEEITERLPAFL